MNDTPFPPLRFPDDADTPAPVPTPSLPDFDAAFGEPFARTLDLRTWRAGEDLIATYGRLEQEVAEALARESADSRRIRAEIFPRLHEGPDAAPGAGIYEASSNDLRDVHRGLLFNGGVEACNGISVVHDTLPLSITQIGVCLVSYNGQQGTWAHRLFRRDIRTQPTDLADEVLAVLERRQRRDGSRDLLSDLARRGIMAYAERALLREQSTAAWRMGHGSPAPFELMSGLWASSARNLRVGLGLIEWYVEHGRFVFVPNQPRKRHFQMLGHALRPREYLVLQTLRPDIGLLIDRGHYRDESGVRPAMEVFRDHVAPKIVMGMFRVWEAAPPRLFFAHADHVHMAAHIAIADAMLQEYRGFPMLIDLADTVCRTTFGVDSLLPVVQGSYAGARYGRSDEPLQYLT